MGKTKVAAPAEDELIELPARAEQMPQQGMYLTQGELKSFVRTLLPGAILENSPAGCFILAKRGARRPLTDPMPNDNQAWLRAAEMLGWEKTSVPA